MRVEKVQHRALKFVYNNFRMSHSQALSGSDTEYQYMLRLRRMLVEDYKISDKLEPMHLHSQVEGVENVRHSGDDRRLVQPKYGTETSVRYQGARLWNDLDQNVKHSMTVKDFKKCIMQWKGVWCKCSFL